MDEDAADLLQRARTARELAAHAQRLADRAIDPADRARILANAAGLLESAEVLEARVQGLKPTNS